MLDQFVGRLKAEDRAAAERSARPWLALLGKAPRLEVPFRAPPSAEGGLRAPARVSTSAMLQSALMNVMIEAARGAGRGLIRDFGEVENLQVSRKGPADFVSAADRRAEEILLEELIRRGPATAFCGEEGGEVAGTDKTHTWIVDPLDGTLNFLHGIPHFASLSRSSARAAASPASSTIRANETCSGPRGQGRCFSTTARARRGAAAAA